MDKELLKTLPLSTVVLLLSTFLFGGGITLLLRSISKKNPTKGLASANSRKIKEERDDYLGLGTHYAKNRNFLTTSLNFVIENGSPCFGHVMNNLMFFVGTPDHSKEVLNSPNFREKAKPSYGRLASFLGRYNLVSAPEEVWRPLRRTLAPIFHLRKMKHSFDKMVQASLGLVQEISGENERFRREVELAKENGVTFQEFSGYPFQEMDSRSVLFALDVITKSLFASSSSSLDHPHLISTIKEASDLYARQVTTPFFSWKHPFLFRRYKSLVKELHSTFLNLVKDRKKLREKELLALREGGPQTKSKKGEAEEDEEGEVVEGQGKDLLDLMLETPDPETGEFLTDEQMSHQCFTFYFAGHETTAHTLAWALWEISHHKEVEEKILREQEEILGDGCDVLPTFQGLKGMKYLTSVIKETLRMHPPIPTIGRCSAKETEVGGVKIPANSSVSVMISANHFSPLVWEDPELFLPERFLSKRDDQEGGAGAGSHPCSWMPFSVGEKNCLGMNFALIELKVVLGILVKRFKITPSLEVLPFHQSSLTASPGNGVHLSFTPRE